MKKQTGLAMIYLLIAIGVLSISLVLAGKWIIKLHQDKAIQQVEITALADSVNAAARVADIMVAANKVLNDELVKNFQEKRRIKAKYDKLTKGITQLETTNDEVKKWFDTCDLPHALFICLQAGNCGEGIGSTNP